MFCAIYKFLAQNSRLGNREHNNPKVFSKNFSDIYCSGFQTIANFLKGSTLCKSDYISIDLGSVEKIFDRLHCTGCTEKKLSEVNGCTIETVHF